MNEPFRRDPASGLAVLAGAVVVLASLALAHPVDGTDEKPADPCGNEARAARNAAFEAAHPLVVDGNLDAWEARERAYLAESSRWLITCPDIVSTRVRRLSAMVAVPDVTDLEVREELQGFFEARKRVGGVLNSIPILKLQAIELMASRRLDLPEADRLLAEIRTESKARERCLKEYDEQCWWLDRAKVRLEMARGGLVEARRSIDAIDAALSVPAPQEKTNDPRLRKERDNRIVQLISLRGELMEASGSRLEAARLYRQAIAQGFTDPVLRRRERRLWSVLDPASREALLRETPPAATAEYSLWSKLDKPFEFSKVQDLSGVEWTPGKLRGKTVLVNFWDTWCAPCVAEMPYIQALHDRTVGSSDLRVITISLDEDPELVAPFVAKHNWTFPVLLGGKVFATQPGGLPSTPSTWIVDASGRGVRWTGEMGIDGVDWVGETLQEMRSVARQAGH